MWMKIFRGGKFGIPTCEVRNFEVGSSEHRGVKFDFLSINYIKIYIKIYIKD